MADIFGKDPHADGDESLGAGNYRLMMLQDVVELGTPLDIDHRLGWDASSVSNAGWKLVAAVDYLPIQLLNLPTYASWLNPIEKLWGWLKQDVLHLHCQSDDWPHLKTRVAEFLDQFMAPSPDLLRYVGLSIRLIY
jgi:hypothetical protein